MAENVPKTASNTKKNSSHFDFENVGYFRPHIRKVQ